MHFKTDVTSHVVFPCETLWCPQHFSLQLGLILTVWAGPRLVSFTTASGEVSLKMFCLVEEHSSDEMMEPQDDRETAELGNPVVSQRKELPVGSCPTSLDYKHQLHESKISFSYLDAKNKTDESLMTNRWHSEDACCWFEPMSPSHN